MNNACLEVLSSTCHNFHTTTAAYYKSRLSFGESIAVSFMSELLKLRDSYLDFSGISHLDQSDIATLIDCVAIV